MIRLFVLIGMLLSLSFMRAQESRLIRHDIGDDKTGLHIHALLQDHQCMLWLGNSNGLARYDGNVWHQMEIGGRDAKVQVTALFEDMSRRIWAGTSSGEIYYVDEDRKVKHFEIEEGHPGKTITAIIQDANGYIWFATYGEGVYVYTGSRLFHIGMDDGLTGEDIYAMVYRKGGEVWLGTDDGINICTFRNEIKSIRKLGLADGLPDQIITALKADPAGNVWIGTFEFGVVRYEASTGKVIRPFASPLIDEVTAFAIFDVDEVWIGTHSSGVWRYNPELPYSRKLMSFDNFNTGRVTAMLSDVEGNMWTVLQDGVLLSAYRPFESIEVQIPEIQSLFCDHLDQLWVGARKGLYRMERSATEVSKAVRMLPQYDFNVTVIREDRFHNLWIGTLDRGLYVYHPPSGKLRHLGSIIDQGGITIMSMAATRQDMWIATLEGVVSYPADINIFSEEKPKFQLLHNGWQSNLHFVFQVFVDSKERVWFATDGNGVYVLDGKKVTRHAGQDSLVVGTVYSICEDQRGHIWFNTPDLGLVEFTGTDYHIIGIKEGLGNSVMASIITCGTGDIVITHQQGIDLMEPERRHFMYYQEEIGIRDMEPGLNAATTDSRGNVYTSGRNFILKYTATQNELSIHPRTQLTRVAVFNEPVDFNQVNSFSYTQNYLSFDYVGLWYTSPSSVKYLYTLEGYDLHWKESKDHQASYSNLTPGTYTFHVKASENNFFLDEPVASYTFTIEPPFWKKIWFVGLMAIVLLVALYWLIKSRERKSERQALLKKEMIESQLSALKAQINPHFLFNSFNTLITIIDENAMRPKIAIEYVEKLSDFYRSILQYREQESISLEEEWELVHNFMYLLKQRYGTNLRLHIDAPPKDAFILPLTLQMLVENAVKHNVISEKYPLDLFITVDADDYVTVSNTIQPKSRTEPSTQFGLQSIVKRYQLLSEKNVIIGKDQEVFRVRIPIIRKTET